jgi:5-methyltetrahydropteroyltriglutamate--homocysteine methyltransferase
MKVFTHNLGFPRVGPKRELKRALEAFWSGKATEADLQATAKAIRHQNWLFQKSLEIDFIPSNDFSFYDHVLDTCVLVGAVPSRFHWHGGNVGLGTYFAMARGVSAANATCSHCGATDAAGAMEMTKWLDTNYHYLVPEFQAGQTFRLASTKPFDEFSEARALGVQTMPVLLGPVSFLLLGKSEPNFDRLSLLPALLPVYEEVLQKLHAAGAEWVQLDEPALVLDLTSGQLASFATSYSRIRMAVPSIKLMLATYFGPLHGNLPTAVRPEVDALHVDATRAPDEVEAIVSALPDHMMLSLGVVDGRNIWKNDFAQSLKFAGKADKLRRSGRLILSPSCSLLHVPVSLKGETKIDSELKGWLAFAEEKLHEVTTLAKLLVDGAPSGVLVENEAAIRSRRQSSRIHNDAVKARSRSVQESDLQRSSPYDERSRKQRARLHLPPLPTTTIGSFPQTEQVRAARARWKRGEMNTADYVRFLEDETKRCVQWQEEIGIDVLVHGEFERNDMVEYFGEQLAGFAFTENGWVQSYGSRCVKPPIIFGDVHRPRPMTVRWSQFAQSLTSKPMKGMLTGPITILQWSFVRDDQPRGKTARQIALAIREEVLDLEAAGISVIQIDEPALREGLPLRRSGWAGYLRWSGDAFRLASSGVKEDTQIHTHMCYCEFNDIIDSIAALDADVISIEASRSKMDLLDAFVNFKYPNEVGPGVWDIHSPRVPDAAEMLQLINAAVRVLPRERLWMNPDCGLKTRRWEEVKAALTNLVSAARQARALQQP